MRPSLFLALPLLALAHPALAQPAPAISVATLKTVDKELSSDAYEGRAPTTPAEDKTVAYIIAQMKAAGLKPGNKGSWTQDVPMVESTFANISPLVFVGGSAPVSLAPNTDMVVRS